MAGRRQSTASAGRLLTRRTRTVWTALLATMTFGGAVLWALDGQPVPRLDGVALRPLVSAAGPASIDSIFRTRQPLDRHRWEGIVIHHSGSAAGSPASIEAQHREMNLAGLGYHFVIGNGRGIEDGELHVGYRWLDQLPGAHVVGPSGDWHNNHSVAICLVGDGRRQEFTEAQMSRLTELVALLCRDLEISPDSVVLHSDIAEVADPGRMFPAATFKQQISQIR
jgi:hypothetical protein